MNKIKIKTIDSSTITSDCWMIQFKGLDACKTCEFLNTEECDGKNIIKKLNEADKIHV